VGKSEEALVRARVVCTFAFFLAVASTGSAATVFNFSGTLPQDDARMFFAYTVQNTGQVDVFTTSFATGGFAPIISVFDNLGSLQFFNVGSQTNDCVNNGTDPATGSCWDARLSLNSVAGTQYTVVLTEDDNIPLGPTLLDGFFEDGNGNFTANPPFNPVVPGGSFLLAGPVQRTPDWAITFSSADPTLSVTGLPEPSTYALFLSGAGLLAFWRRRTRNHR
jgi:hypothetical protein